MSDAVRFSSLLVPTDFSAGAMQACQQALRWVDGDDATVVVLHVIDAEFVQRVTSYGFAAQEAVETRLREQAEAQFSTYRQQATDRVQLDTLVSVGLPFVEILRKAEDFAVDAIVMASGGQRTPFESLLFGSTAEKVLRGSRRPVIVLPANSDVRG